MRTLILKRLPRPRRRQQRGRTGLLLLLLPLLAGCFPGEVPTQQSPRCSWDSTPPARADTICQTIFQTLSTVVRAEVSGDNRTVRRLVPTRLVADRIIAYGETVRAGGDPSVHVVPSFTLDNATRSKYIGAGFYLLGKTRSGKLQAPETVYLQIRHGQAFIVDDQPGEEW